VAPTWRRLFNSIEAAVAPGVEDLTASTEFRDVMAIGAKLGNALNKQAEEASRQWLHWWNLPTATDIRRLRRQISDLDQEVGALRVALRSVVDDRTADRLIELASIDVDDSAAAGPSSN
jgi:hypothetical protein